MSTNVDQMQNILQRLEPYVLLKKDFKKYGFPQDTASLTSNYGAQSDKETDTRRNVFTSCSRCHRTYAVTSSGQVSTHEKCIFHPEKAINLGKFSLFPCCNKVYPCRGCETLNYHVNSSIVCDVPFVKTMPVMFRYAPLTNVYALDTEMCYTTKGLEVTKVSLVRFDKTVVFNAFVLPRNPIIDYNTRFSGVTAHDLKDVTATLREVQNKLKRFIRSDTILIGHALNNDLRALGLVHKRVVDTSVAFPHKLGHPRKNSLKVLVSKLLHKKIQGSSDGHCSVEDATACIELMEYKIYSDITDLSSNY